MTKVYENTQKSERNDYQTPEFIYKPILRFEEVREFDLDVCCSVQNIPARRYITDGILDGLSIAWCDLNWMNPEFVKADKWIKKAYEESLKGRNTYAILPARIETVYFAKYIKNNPNCFWVSLTKNKNLGFIHPETKQFMGQYKNPLCIVYFGSNAKERAIRWHKEQPIPGSVHYFIGGTHV